MHASAGGAAERKLSTTPHNEPCVSIMIGLFELACPEGSACFSLRTAKFVRHPLAGPAETDHAGAGAGAGVLPLKCRRTVSRCQGTASPNSAPGAGRPRRVAQSA